jgi:hypothetical protein
MRSRCSMLLLALSLITVPDTGTAQDLITHESMAVMWASLTPAERARYVEGYRSGYLSGFLHGLRQHDEIMAMETGTRMQIVQDLMTHDYLPDIVRSIYEIISDAANSDVTFSEVYRAAMLRARGVPDWIVECHLDNARAEARWLRRSNDGSNMDRNLFADEAWLRYQSERRKCPDR